MQKIVFIESKEIKYYYKKTNPKLYSTLLQKKQRKKIIENFSLNLNKIILFRRYCNSKEERNMKSFVQEIENSKLSINREGKQTKETKKNLIKYFNYSENQNSSCNFINLLTDATHPVAKSLKDYLMTFSFTEESFLIFLKENILKEISWEETLKKKLLENFEYKEFIPLERQKEIFSLLITDMRRHHKLKYKELLLEKIGYNNELTWHDAQNLLQSEERFRRVLEEDRKKIFEEYIESLFSKIESEFINLVEESEFITKDINVDGYDFDKVVARLAMDVRGKRMMKFPERRDKHIKAKVRRLQQGKGKGIGNKK